jgi:DNA repair exonuclease SbcCD ATPase subunit
MTNAINISYVKWQAFRSFKDPQTTGMLPDSGLFGIVGKNNNTTGSSGSGKTNFHYAISYALGYCPVPATELQSWLTKEPMQVELGLSTPKGPVIVKRGQETSITIEGEVFVGARVVENKLREILGLPINLIEALTFRQQKLPGRFLSMTDSEKKDFLSILLGLEDIENQIDAANKKANDAEKEWLQLNTIASTLRSQLRAPKAGISKDPKPYNDIILEYSQYLPPHDGRINNLNVKLKTQREVIESCVVDDGPQIVAKKQEREVLVKTKTDLEAHILHLNNELTTLNKSYQALSPLLKDKEQVLLDLQSINALIKGINEAICPTCEQEFIVSQDRLVELYPKMEQLEKKRDEQAEAQEKLNIVYRDREQLTKAIQTLQKELIKVRSQIDLIDIDIRNAQIEYQGNMTQALWLEYRTLEKQLKAAQDERAKITDIIDENRAIIREIERENDLNVKQYVDASNRYNELLQEIEKVQARAATYHKVMCEESDLAAMLKSFLGTIFAEILQEIAIETNEMLKQLPNVAATTIQFDTEVVSQKGKSRQEIKPVFYKNGESVSVKSGLSGGQFTSVELATDLAVGKIIAQRTGLSLNWLVLDESFEGHDVPVKEACLELLRNAAKDKLIFVIDHATEVNAYFDKCITIHSDNDCSYIKEVV